MTDQKPEDGKVKIELIMPAHHVERLDTVAKSAGITRAQAVSMLLLHVEGLS